MKRSELNHVIVKYEEAFTHMDSYHVSLPKHFNPKKVAVTGIVEPSMYKSKDGLDEYDCIILCENNDKKYLRQLINTFYSQFKGDEVPTLLVLAVFDFHITYDDITGKITDFYQNNKIDLTKYIKPHSKVIAVGRVILPLTNGDFTSINGFYDYIFNNPYFYSPELQSMIFPIDSYFYWIKDKKILDNWEHNFAASQMIRAVEFNDFNRTIKTYSNVIKDFDQFMIDHANEKEVALDTETDSLDFCVATPGCLSISFDGRIGYAVEWESIDPIRLGAFVKDKFQIYQNGKYDIKVLLKNGVPRQDLHVDADTLNLGHLMNEMRNKGLKSLAWVYTQMGGYDSELDIYTSKHKVTNYLKIPRALLYTYAIKDAIVTYQVFKAMSIQMDKIDKFNGSYGTNKSLRNYFYNEVMPTVNTFIDIECQGVYIDKELMLKEQVNLLKQLVEQRDKIIQIFDIDLLEGKTNEEKQGIHKIARVNIDSQKKFGEFLEARGYRALERSKDNSYMLTGKEQIKRWINIGYKEFESISEYRRIKSFLDTFVGADSKKGFLKFLRYHPEDDSWRIHGSYAVMLLLSHRIGCSKPNLQNIPKQNKESRSIRRMFRPPSEDFLLAEYDAAGFQLRIGAALSQDEEMMKVFNSHGDLHSLTAQNILMRDVDFDTFMKNKHDSPYKEARFKAKAINFGFEFGSTGFNFAMQSLVPEWNLKEIEDYIKKYYLENNIKKLKDNKFIDESELPKNFHSYWAVGSHIRREFFTQYHGLANWIETSQKDACKTGYVISQFGAIRRVPELTAFGNDGLIIRRGHHKNLLNITLNSPVQNFEVVLIARTMNKLHKFIQEHDLKSSIFMTIHDSILVYLHKDEIDIINKKVKEFFEEQIPESEGVFMKMEGTIADYYGKDEAWGEGYEID